MDDLLMCSLIIVYKVLSCKEMVALVAGSWRQIFSFPDSAALLRQTLCVASYNERKQKPPPPML